MAALVVSTSRMQTRAAALDRSFEGPRDGQESGQPDLFSYPPLCLSDALCVESSKFFCYRIQKSMGRPSAFNSLSCSQLPRSDWTIAVLDSREKRVSKLGGPRCNRLPGRAMTGPSSTLQRIYSLSSHNSVTPFSVNSGIRRTRNSSSTLYMRCLLQ
jgi:hypothetical protein